MTYILEYNEQYGVWHNNYFDERRQCFHNKLFSNGYKPVCMFNDFTEPDHRAADGLREGVLLREPFSGKLRNQNPRI
jgi:hypothetical protein